LAEGLSAVKAFKIAQQDIKDYKLQVQSYEDKISLMNNVSKQKDLQLDNLQEQLSIKEEQLNNAERRIAQLRLKNGLVIGVGIAVAVGASVAAIYFATK
jgi:chromosome segregation ATPase